MKLLDVLLDKWYKLPAKAREEIESAFNTFVPAFIGSLVVSAEILGSEQWTLSLVLAVLSSAARAGFKATMAYMRRRVSYWIETRNK